MFIGGKNGYIRNDHRRVVGGVRINSVQMESDTISSTYKYQCAHIIVVVGGDIDRKVTEDQMLTNPTSYLVQLCILQLKYHSPS